jgi:drug/metabolite transporter (DMT)-like permease
MTTTPGALSTRAIALTAVAMLAFAGNSLLCRLALAPRAIDAASFAGIRIAAGALMLAAIMLARGEGAALRRPDWRTVVALFAYVIFFSFAYLTLSAGTGALILFGAVQLTMFAVALRRGEHFPPLAWAGLVVAILGLVYLVSPGVTAPDAPGAVLMAIAGIAWGIYSLLGRGVADPLAATARNFLYAVPLAIVVSAAAFGGAHATATGVALAIASGAVTSGLGYAIWYAALPLLNATSAATVQLSVPVIAAIGGVILIGEPPSLRLALATVAVIGGVIVVLTQRTGRTHGR